MQDGNFIIVNDPYSAYAKSLFFSTMRQKQPRVFTQLL